MVEDDLGATRLGGMIETVIRDNIEEDLAPPMAEGQMITTHVRGTDIISLRTNDNQDSQPQKGQVSGIASCQPATLFAKPAVSIHCYSLKVCKLFASHFP